MPKKNTPGCHCCQGCVIYSDDFQRDDDTDVGGLWDERIGDWEIDAGDLVCDAAGLIVVDQLHPDGDNAMVVTATVRGDTASDTARVVLCRLNDSNYLFVQLRFVSNFSSALRLGKVEAGVETFLTSEVSVAAGMLADITIVACYADGNLSGQVFDSGLHRDTLRVAATAPGTTVGLAIGQQNGAILFRSFAWEYHNSEDRPSCRSCAEPCSGCEENTTPYAVQVEFQGVTDSLFGFNPCDDCSVLNNRAFLLRPNSNNACFYFLGTGIGCNLTYLSAGICGSVFTTTYLWIVEIGASIGALHARFGEEDADGDCAATEADCVEAFTGVSSFGGVNNNVCNWDNATCTITPLR